MSNGRMKHIFQSSARHPQFEKISSLSLSLYLSIYSLLFVHAKYFYSRQTTMMSSMRWIWQKHFTMVQFPTCKSRKGDARENYYDAVRESLAPSFSLSLISFS